LVAVTNTSASLSDALNYNEKKVAQNDAILIHAGGFLKEFARLNFYEKEERFKPNNDLKSDSNSNTLHASLNFDPSERLTDAQLAQIAHRYPVFSRKHRETGRIGHIFPRPGIESVLAKQWVVL
jgi:hypothetical protein